MMAILLGTQLLIGCSQRESSSSKSNETLPSPEQVQRVELLNQTADDMYNKVMQGDITGGRMVLQQLGDQVTQIQYYGIASVEGMNALAETVTQAKRAFNAAKYSPDEGQVYVAKIRLATDALTHTNQPMWLQYYKLLIEDVNGIERSAVDKQKQGLTQFINQLAQHYAVIHPSLLISRNPGDVEQADSLMVFLSNQLRSDQDPYSPVTSVITPLRQIIDKLFLKKDAAAYLPIVDQQNPIYWTLVLGSFILAALAFAGWRLSRKDNGLVPVRKKDEA
ncbi:hypothetical protein CF651_02825 [Paenibacillus rigui]|uniref:Sporulation protein n=1 Tax=Paenibacillus rigui TaxID=554312 RepID=A0A229UXR4_9BACL|nr:hypothetical protein CF651_02825 [Paenibacillus rigui]